MATTKKTTAKTNPTAKENRPKSWADITGRMRVWGKEVEYKRKSFMSYSTSIGKKNDNDEYDNLYYNVRFKKDSHPDIEGAFDIDVKSGFLTVTTDKKGNCYPAVMVMDYDLVDESDYLPY